MPGVTQMEARSADMARKDDWYGDKVRERERECVCVCVRVRELVCPGAMSRREV